MARKEIKEWLTLKEWCELTGNEPETIRQRIKPQYKSVNKKKSKYQIRFIDIPEYKTENIFNKNCLFLKNPQFLKGSKNQLG